MVEWVIGRRAIDLPLRLIGLLLALTALLPGAVDAQESVPLTLFLVSRLLLVATPFVPVWTGAVAGGLFLVHLVAEPTLLNPFEECLVFCFGVLLASGRKWAAVTMGASSLALLVLESWVQPDLVSPLPVVVFLWGLVALLGLFALLFERRIQAEITRRETIASRHAREMQQFRIDVAIDAHDTISHELATQAAMLRLVSSEESLRGLRRGMGEIALVNERAQQGLRSLLDGLRGRELAPLAEADPGSQLLAGLDSLLAAAEAGGYEVRIDVDLPNALPSRELSDQLLMISRELVTNIVKHSSTRNGNRLLLRPEGEGSQTSIILETFNVVEEGGFGIPQSVRVRAERLGGSCRSTREGGSFRVTVKVPWSAV